MTPEQHKAMRVRNAILELLRAWEEQHDLPRAISTKAEGRDGPTRMTGGHTKH